MFLPLQNGVFMAGWIFVLFRFGFGTCGLRVCIKEYAFGTCGLRVH